MRARNSTNPGLLSSPLAMSEPSRDAADKRLEDKRTHFSEALGVFFSSPLAKGPSAASFMKLTRTSALTPNSGFPRSFRMEAWRRKYT